MIYDGGLRNAHMHVPEYTRCVPEIHSAERRPEQHCWFGNVEVLEPAGNRVPIQ